MTEQKRVDVAIRQEDGSSPPQLLCELVVAINALIPDASHAAGRWFHGKGEAEVAKAIEIKANVLKKIAEIENDRQRLIQERDQSARDAERLGQQDQFAHEQKMYELRTQRLKEGVDSIMRLRDLGAEVDLKIFSHLARELLAATREKPI